MKLRIFVHQITQALFLASVFSACSAKTVVIPGIFGVGLGSTPILASVDITNSTPTASTTYNLSYGAVTGSYSHYCILENDTTVGNCTWIAGVLPASFVVDATEEIKTLSFWLRSSTGLVSARVNSDSVRYSTDVTPPVLASVDITNANPTDSTTYNLSYGAVTGTYADYCILENDTTVGNCGWVTGVLPASFVVDTTELSLEEVIEKVETQYRSLFL